MVVIASAVFAAVEGRSSSRVVVEAPAAVSTSSTVTGLGSTSTTTVPRACAALLHLVALPDTPQTVVVTTTNGATQYSAPVGTVFVVHLSHGTDCNGPYWSLPTVGPTSVVSRVPGTPVSAGATAEGTFKVVGPGDGRIRFQGICGPSTTFCAPGDSLLIIVAREPGTAATTTTVALPRTG